MRHRVFISWSGETTCEVAALLQGWIPKVLQNARPWNSTEINPGSLWVTELANALSTTSLGIVCLASDNVTSSWLQFEAGALSKSVDASAVIPYLLDIDFGDLPGPLRQFQAVRADEEGTWSLVCALNERLGEDGIDRGLLLEVFKKWWPDIAGSLAACRASASTTTSSRKLEMIASAAERTRRIVADLRALRADLVTTAAPQVVRYCGFLSAFAIGDAPLGAEAAYWELLKEERDLMLELARSGVTIRCIISPPGMSEVILDRREYAIDRLSRLAAFLRTPDEAHASIEWSVCAFRQKNTYIVGDRAFYEGYKKGASGGYDFTLRQSTQDSLHINSTLFDALYRHLESETLIAFERVGASKYAAFPNSDSRIDKLRRSTLAQVEQSVETVRTHPAPA